jgi:hypothetical protein
MRRATLGSAKSSHICLSCQWRLAAVKYSSSLKPFSVGNRTSRPWPSSHHAHDGAKTLSTAISATAISELAVPVVRNRQDDRAFSTAPTPPRRSPAVGQTAAAGPDTRPPSAPSPNRDDSGKKKKSSAPISAAKARKKAKAKKLKPGDESDLLQKAAKILREVLVAQNAPTRPDKGEADINEQDTTNKTVAEQATAELEGDIASASGEQTAIGDPKGKSASKQETERLMRREKPVAAQPSKKAATAKGEVASAAESAPASTEVAPWLLRRVLAPESTLKPVKPAKATKAAKPTRAAKPKRPPPSKAGNVQSVRAHELELEPVAKDPVPVPQLSYQLDRVLFNPGVHFLQDPRTRVFNFDPYLASIMPINEFDFKALKQYITSSKDVTLISMAKEAGKRYTGSTSSMTTFLAHFHYLLSAWRPINPANISQSFKPDSFNFTRLNRAPSAAFLHWKDGVYAIDADKEFDSANILSMLGKSMEKLMTLKKADYERYRLTNPEQISEAERTADESFHYTGLGDFLMRSQLDANDPRVLGTGMFDLKTRAVVSIRMDAREFHKGLGYEIRQRFGQWESYEREYYDMIRSAFMKYSLQVRMGRMDGIFVAYHNTERIFGFQYISLPEMDLAIHGTEDTTLGDSEFKLSIHLLNKLLDRATAKYPDKSLRIHVETRPTEPPVMYFFAQPVEPQEIEEVQNAGRKSIEDFERNLTEGRQRKEEDPEIERTNDEEDSSEIDAATLAEPGKRTDEVENLQTIDGRAKSGETSGPVEPENGSEDDGAGNVWENMLTKVEEALEDEELGATSVRESIEDALEESGLLRAKTPEEAREYVDALLDAITEYEPAEPVAKSEHEENNHNDVAEEEAVAAGTVDVEAAESATESLDAEARPSEVKSVPKSTGDTPDDVEEVRQTDDALEHSTDDVIEAKTSLQASKELPVVTSLRADEDEPPSLDYVDAESQADVGDAATQQQTGASPAASLKDILVRLTEQVQRPPEERPPLDTADEQGAEISSADLLKLRKFESILTELTSSSQSPLSPVDEAITESAKDDGVAVPEEHPKASSVAVEPPSETSDHLPAYKKVRRVQKAPNGDVTGWTVSVRHHIRGEYITRAEKLTEETDWKLEYSISEMPAERSRRIYEMVKRRRKQRYDATRNKNSQWSQLFEGQLKKYVKKGIAYRKKEEALTQRDGVFVYPAKHKVAWSEATRSGHPAPGTQASQQSAR